MKRHRFYCFISFAQNADIHMSGKRRNSTIGQKLADNYLYNGLLNTSRCIKTVIIFQQHFVFNIDIKASVKLFQKIGTIFRSSNNSKWQARMRETDADRSWQASHGEPWTNRRDEQGRSNARHSCLVRTLHSYSRGPGGAVLAHSSEREKSDSEGDASKVETQKNGSTSIHTHFRKNQKRSILRAEKYGDFQQQSTKSSARDVILGTITDTLSWYKFSPFSGISVIPKLHKRRRSIYEISQSRRRSHKSFMRTIH